ICSSSDDDKKTKASQHVKCERPFYSWGTFGGLAVFELRIHLSGGSMNRPLPGPNALLIMSSPVQPLPAPAEQPTPTEPYPSRMLPADFLMQTTPRPWCRTQ